MFQISTATELSTRGNPPAAVGPEQFRPFVDGLLKMTVQLEAHHREQLRPAGRR